MSTSAFAIATDRAPVFRDPIRQLTPRTTSSTAVSTAPFIEVDDFDSLIGSPHDRTTQLANGMVQMGPADGLLLSIAGAGADNAALAMYVFGYAPVAELGSDPDDVTFWERALLHAAPAIALGTSTVAASLANAIAGLESGDRLADVVAFNNPANHTRNVSMAIGANFHGGTPVQGAEKTYVSAAGYSWLQVVLVNTTTTAAVAWGKRVRGQHGAPSRGS